MRVILLALVCARVAAFGSRSLDDESASADSRHSGVNEVNAREGPASTEAHVWGERYVV